MFTKLDMINSQLVLTSSIKLRHDDVISDVTANRFRLEFSVFGTREYCPIDQTNKMAFYFNFDLIYVSRPNYLYFSI